MTSITLPEAVLVRWRKASDRTGITMSRIAENGILRELDEMDSKK